MIRSKAIFAGSLLALAISLAACASGTETTTTTTSVTTQNGEVVGSTVQKDTTSVAPDGSSVSSSTSTSTTAY